MSSTTHRADIIGIFAQHKVAANLLMLMMLIGGFVSLSKLNTQFFPNFALDVITVNVVWRGASAEDVEDSLTSRIEQELRTIDYVDKMTSTSSYGSSLVTLEFDEGTEMGPALDQVKDHVARLRNLPKDAETPEISIATHYDNVARLLVTTDGHLDELRGLVHQIEHELLDAGISRVTITGLPDEEMAIKVSTSTLESLGLSFGDVSQRVADQSQDLPAGEIGNGETTRQIRSLDQRRNADAFGSISLKSDYQGRRLLLDDVADVERRAMRDQVKVFYHGQPAVEIALQRTENADALESARIMENWLEQAKPSLPKGVDIRVYDASWSLIQERINLLLSNGLSGLLLVLAILFLFLSLIHI